MEGSLQDGPPRRSRVGRPPLVVVAAIVGVALAIVAVVAASDPEPEHSKLAVTQYGGLAFTDTTVYRGGDGARVTASVELDGDDITVANSATPNFVVYQFAGGRFDTPKHSDDREAMRVLGYEDSDTLQILPTDTATRRVDPSAHPKSGEYSMTIDGSVEYTDIPSGTWELRAYVLDEGGRWNGEVATREIVVR